MRTSVDRQQAPAAFNFTRDVVERLAADPSRPAFTHVGGDGIIRRQTYAELAADAARWAHLLRGRGHHAGERVLILVGSAPDWAPIVLGALKAGLVAVPCPAGIDARELADRAAATTATLLVAAPEEHAATDALRDLDRHVDVVLLDEAPSLLARCRSVAPTEARRPGDPALVLYTAGATGPPRGVVHGVAYTGALGEQAGDWLDARPGDVVWCTAPPGQTTSIWGTLGPWSNGAEVVMHAGGDAHERVELIERLGVTVLCQTPAEHRALAEQDILRPGSLRHVASTGDPLRPDVASSFLEASGLTIHDGYGQTETAVLIASTPEDPAPEGSMGRVVPGYDVAVVDEHGHPVGPDEVGEIALRGRPDALFLGYLGAPDAAAAASRGEWYLTGDRAVRDEQDAFWFAGRADDQIVSGGKTVNAFDVEGVLLLHPLVSEAAVVGRPSRKHGQVATAVVVARPTDDRAAVVREEVAAHAARELGEDSPALTIELVASLPLSTGGKVDRAALRRPRARRSTSPAEGQAAVETTPPRGRLRLVSGGAHATDGRFDASPLEAAETDDGTSRRSRWAERSQVRAAERAHRERQEAARREAEEARRAASQRKREEADEAQARAAAAKKEEDARLREETRALEEVAAAARRAAKETERAARDAERAEERRVLAAARAQQKIEDERRRAEERERKAEERRLRAEADERSKADERARRAEEQRRRAEVEEAEERRAAEAAQLRRQQEATRRAEQEAAEAEAARARMDEQERRRQETQERTEAEARLRAATEERRRRENEEQSAERERAKTEALVLAEARRRADEEARLRAEARAAAEAQRQAEAEAQRQAEAEARERAEAEREAREAAARQRQSEAAERRRQAELAREQIAADARRRRHKSEPDAPDDDGDIAALMIERIQSYGMSPEQTGSRDD